tara:strand:+ start:85 stop:618 length:534 start_codon:yes stop_codon:yes gene_type:complete
MNKQKIDWIFYPKNNLIPELLSSTVDVFEQNINKIDSTENDNNLNRLKSDEVLRVISNGLEELSYQVEKSKKAIDKIRIPVMFGKGGVEELAFEADAYHPEFKTVVEVEAGRAVINYQFLKDIFQASMMLNTDYLVMAVRKSYRGQNDFEKINSFLEAMYLTNKIKLDLKGILLIGY